MEYREEEEYVLLNFKDAVNQKFFEKPNLFFKIANFQSKKPLFQIGDHVFEAKTDEESLGTSLIFEEHDGLPPKNIYEQQTNIHLKYIAKTCKFLTLQWLKLPDEVPDIEESELVVLEFKHSYESVLKQLEDDNLDINDIVKKPEPEHEANEDNCAMQPEQNPTGLTVPVSQPDATDSEREEDVLLPELKVEVVSEPLQEEEDENYTLLKEMVHRQINDPEYYRWLPDDIDDATTDIHFKIMKEVYFKSFDYNHMKLEANAGHSLWRYVDLKGSIDNGVIEMKERFTQQDKAKLFSLENFDNFNAELKIIVLMDYLKEEKEAISGMTKVELMHKDVFGRTIKQRYKMVKSLVKDLKYNLFAKSFFSSASVQF